MSLDTLSHQSYFRYWNKLNTHNLLPLKLLIYCLPSFSLTPSAPYICGKNKFFFIPFAKAAEQSLLSPLFWKHAIVSFHPREEFSPIPPEDIYLFFLVYVNEKFQKYEGILKIVTIPHLQKTGKF